MGWLAIVHKLGEVGGTVGFSLAACRSSWLASGSHDGSSFRKGLDGSRDRRPIVSLTQLIEAAREPYWPQ